MSVDELRAGGRGPRGGRGPDARAGPRRDHRRRRRRRTGRSPADVHRAALAVGARRRKAPVARGLSRDRWSADRGREARGSGDRADDAEAAGPCPAHPPAVGGRRRRRRARPTASCPVGARCRRRPGCPDSRGGPGGPAAADRVGHARRGRPRGAAAGVAAAAGLARRRRGGPPDAPAPRPGGSGLAQLRSRPGRAVPGSAADRCPRLHGRARRRPDRPGEGLPPGRPGRGRRRRCRAPTVAPETPGPGRGARGRPAGRPGRRMGRARPAERVGPPRRRGGCPCPARGGAR